MVPDQTSHPSQEGTESAPPAPSPPPTRLVWYLQARLSRGYNYHLCGWSLHKGIFKSLQYSWERATKWAAEQSVVASCRSERTEGAPVSHSTTTGEESKGRKKKLHPLLFRCCQRLSRSLNDACSNDAGFHQE